MRFAVSNLGALALAGCATAQMRLPDNLATASRTEFDGIGGWESGRYSAGPWSGTYERSATQLSFLIPLVQNRGHAEFTMARAGGVEISGECRMRESSIDLGLAEVTTRPMAFNCQIVDGRSRQAWLELQEVDSGHINRYARHGRIELGGETVDIRSVHHLSGTSLPTATPIGYVFVQRGRAVGAVELNGKPVLMVEPGASPELERALTVAALALGVFWDPANTLDS